MTINPIFTLKIKLCKGLDMLFKVFFAIGKDERVKEKANANSVKVPESSKVEILDILKVKVLEIFKIVFLKSSKIEVLESLKTIQTLCESDFGHTHPWWGPPRQAPAAVSPPPPLTRLQPPCPLFDPIFFGKEVANSNLIHLSKTRTLHLLTRLHAPVIGGRTILPMPLHQYGCGRGIATNSSPPNEGPPVSLDYQTKVNRVLIRRNFFKSRI
jgi:hypothetical protein